MRPASALTPELALAYVRELSTDVRAGVALGPAGERLAGPDALAAPARELLAASGTASELAVTCADGIVCALRSGRHALVVVCGRFALAAIVLQDLRAALRGLEGASPAPGPGAAGDADAHAARRAANTLVSTAQRGFPA